MKKIFITFCLSLFSISCLAQSVPVYAEFIGGLNMDNIKSCTVKMQDRCQGILKSEDNNVQWQNEKEGDEKAVAYATCMRQQMQNEDICTQNLALLNKLNPNFVEIVNVQHYPLFDAVETMVNKDIKQKWYFIVNYLGEFIDTRDIYADIKNSTTYPYFIRKYPNADLGDVQPGFPRRFENLPIGEMRLVSARSIVNKINDCIKCEVIGIMEDGYDFKPNGEFKWVKFIKLIPNEPSF
jgi:hypothetical protein